MTDHREPVTYAEFTAEYRRLERMAGDEHVKRAGAERDLRTVTGDRDRLAMQQNRAVELLDRALALHGDGLEGMGAAREAWRQEAVQFLRRLRGLE